MSAKYQRILLKLSGEALMGEQSFGIDPQVLSYVAKEVKQLISQDVQVGIVIGGGNIFRGVGLASSGMDRVAGDHMGMLATVINSLALQDALEKNGVPARVMSALPIHQVCEDYIRRRAVRHLEKSRVVIFAAGTGNPFFTTDSAASLRGIEIDADIVIKATKVDGVYSADPVKNKNAKKFKSLQFIDALKKKLKVMDATAISMCMDNNLPIVVFSLKKVGNIKRVVFGEKIGTTVK